MKITKAWLRKQGACYSELELAEVFGKIRSFTPLEVADLKIPVKDRIWVLLHEDIIPSDTLHELCCKFAERRIRDYDAPEKLRQSKAIKAKRDWLAGKISKEEMMLHAPLIACTYHNAYWHAETAGMGTWVLNQIRKVLSSESA